MTLDISTIFVVFGIGSFFVLIVLLLYLFKFNTSRQSVITYAVSKLLYTVAFALFSQRETLSAPWIVYITNVLLIFGLSLETYSTATSNNSFNKKLFTRSLVIGVIGSLIFLYFIPFSTQVWVISMSFIIALMALYGAMITKTKLGSFFSKIIKAVYYLIFILMLIRGFYPIFAQQDIALLTFTFTAFFTYIAFFLLTYLTPFLYLLVTKERDHIEIKVSHKKYMEVVNNNGQGFILMDNLLRIIETNTSFLSISGYTSDEVLGKTFLSFLNSEHTEKLKHNLSNKKFNFEGIDEISMIHKNGEEIPLLINGSKINDSSEANIFLFAFIQDISYRVKVEQELKSALNTRNKFFSIIAHDLRGPSGAVLQLIKVLQGRNSEHSEETNKLIDVLHSGATKFNSLLNNLLTWSRLQQNKIEITPQAITVEQIIPENINLLQNSAKNKNITLTTELDQNLTAWADINTLNTILRNLIGNSIKYSFPNSTIFIKAKQLINEKKILFSIKDNGTGIKPKVLKSLFSTEDIQSTPGTNKEQGSGLGLLLCKEFVELNHGEISVTSTEGQGAEFLFTVPSASA